MIYLGYIPESFNAVIEQIPGGLTLNALEMISKRSGASQGAGGQRGIGALLSQPVSNLNSFLPKEKKEELLRVIEELNRQ